MSASPEDFPEFFFRNKPLADENEQNKCKILINRVK